MTTSACETFFRPRCYFQRLAEIRREQRGDADDVRFQPADFFLDLVKGFTEVIIAMKGREWRLVRNAVEFAQVAQFSRDGHGPATGTAVIVSDDDFDVGKMFDDGGL